MAALDVEIWSDIACPWCYVGKRRFETALQGFEERASVRVKWRSFELNPSAPRTSEESGPYAARLAKKYGSSLREAEARLEHLVQLASAEGIALDFDRIRPGNTFDAHRILHLAAARGREDEAKECFLRGYLCEGEAIGERDVVARLAERVGLNADEVSAALASDDFAAEVRADEAAARELGISGVPCFVLGGRYAVSGAQPAELLLGALRQAYAELARPLVDLAEGAACGPDGCP